MLIRSEVVYGWEVKVLQLVSEVSGKGWRIFS